MTELEIIKKKKCNTCDRTEHFLLKTYPNGNVRVYCQSCKRETIIESEKVIQERVARVAQEAKEKKEKKEKKEEK